MTKSSLNVFICTGLCKHGCKVACRHTSWQGKVMPKWNLFPLQILFYFHNTFMRSKAMLASFLSPNTSHQTCAEGLPTQSNCESSAPWSPLSCTSWLMCFQSYMLGFLEKKNLCLTYKVASWKTFFRLYSSGSISQRFVFQMDLN